MNKLKSQIAYIKARKPERISQKDYGEHLLDGMFPLTNRYVKQRKGELKREYRAAKRSDKQRWKREAMTETS